VDSLPLDTILHGDCLELLHTLPDASVDAVVTDPPYMIGASSVGSGSAKSGTWADMENAAYWYAAWFTETKRILRLTGFLAVFTNWRSLPTLMRALTLAKMMPTSCLVWDKMWIGPGGRNGLRPRYELVLVSAMPDAVVPDRAAPDIFACKWMAGNMKTTSHPAEKPVAVMQHLCRLLVPAGGVVLDPFAGSGTTCVAARDEGMRYLGMEREAEYVEIARVRLAGETLKPNKPRRKAAMVTPMRGVPTLWEGVSA